MYLELKHWQLVCNGYFVENNEFILQDTKLPIFDICICCRSITFDFFLTWNMSSISLANMDPALWGLNGESDKPSPSATAGAFAPVDIPEICTDDPFSDEAAAVSVTADTVSVAFLSSVTVLADTSFTVA